MAEIYAGQRWEQTPVGHTAVTQCLQNPYGELLLYGRNGYCGNGCLRLEIVYILCRLFYCNTSRA